MKIVAPIGKAWLVPSLQLPEFLLCLGCSKRRTPRLRRFCFTHAQHPLPACWESLIPGGEFCPKKTAVGGKIPMGVASKGEELGPVPQGFGPSFRFFQGAQFLFDVFHPRGPKRWYHFLEPQPYAQEAGFQGSLAGKSTPSQGRRK